MPYKEIFKRGICMYVIDKTPDESRETYLERVFFTINLHEKKNIPIDECIELSLLWRNVHIYNMMYSCHTMKKLDTIMN